MRVTRTVKVSRDQLALMMTGLSEKEIFESLKSLIEKNYIRMTYHEKRKIYEIQFLDHSSIKE